ncbi:VOC family protein [Bacillus spizizenii]|uniref:SMU1112c/YaeR family gloxylase I-like metalloprotein n=1 Tax=Bacillus spizizenii TaxID=96241 RepID=UPI00227F6DFD|nr:VOC family protein [Bacillus spizizenii]MCY7796022.1 VOC family protein [Bacillus spizizenii]MCY7802151.1 VOC family protein [Bacillus spizizenii]MCY7896963.1 VOC family protein [Bacillus spizizenii]MCY8212889.1 VOC family protein [Bacillus spizizenii]MEC3799040.1 VOC family protein [Bacillus spizizenii]
MLLKSIHHIAIICSDFEKSKAFYVHKLGFQVIQETYREDRGSYKLDLSLNGSYVIELFSFPDPPARQTWPEAAGLRHLAFTVGNLDEAVQELHEKGIKTEPIRTDPLTGKKFTFFFDPDQLPLELYEQ